MSEVTVAQAKAYIPVIHSSDDALLQTVIDGAEDEVKRFTDRSQLPTLPVDDPPEYDSNSDEIAEDVPSDGDPIAPSIRMAILLLVKAYYRADTAEIEKARAAAQQICWPYRARLGA